MGIFKRILGTADPATGRTGRAATDPRMRGSGRGTTPKPSRGKVPPGSGRFGVDKSRAKAGRGRQATPAPRGLGRLLGSLTGRH
jgi:hypothetical protein